MNPLPTGSVTVADAGTHLWKVLTWSDGTYSLVRSYPDRTVVGAGRRGTRAEILAVLAEHGIPAHAWPKH